MNGVNASGKPPKYSADFYKKNFITTKSGASIHFDPETNTLLIKGSNERDTVVFKESIQKKGSKIIVGKSRDPGLLSDNPVFIGPMHGRTGSSYVFVEKEEIFNLDDLMVQFGIEDIENLKIDFSSDQPKSQTISESQGDYYYHVGVDGSKYENLDLKDWNLVVNGGQGSDRIQISNPSTSSVTIDGKDGDDSIYVSQQKDTIKSLEVTGGEGKDELQLKQINPDQVDLKDFIERVVVK